MEKPGEAATSRVLLLLVGSGARGGVVRSPRHSTRARALERSRWEEARGTDRWVAAGEAAVPHDVRVYDGVGHAFLDLDQIRRGEQPQAAAWGQCVGFLRAFFAGEDIPAAK
jgi:dienelactone hydrolase